jgi:hypothetical protein
MNTECYEYDASCLGETSSEIREQAICELTNWLDENPHIHAHRDIMLLYFIRGCKYNLEKAKKKIRR